MKRLIVAATVLGAAVLPATAGAVPPNSQGGPLGSAACTVFGSPAPLGTSSCNFTGASGGLGYIGGSSGGVALTHIVKTVHCDTATGLVDGFVGTVKPDATSAGNAPFAPGGPGYNFVVGRVYTLTVTGQGWASAGGPSTPSATPPAEPATPSAANNWAGAENGTGGLGVGDPCPTP